MPPSPPPPLLLASTAEQTSYGMEHPFGQLGSAVLAMSPHKLLPTPSLLAFGVGGVGGQFGEMALMLWEHCPGVAKTLVCYQHLSSYKAEHYEGCYGESEFHPSQTQYSLTWSVLAPLHTKERCNVLQKKKLRCKDVFQDMRNMT